MNMKTKSHHFLVFMLCILCNSHIAFAQNSFPEMRDINKMQSPNIPIQPDLNSFRVDNDYFADLMKIQYQISVLERLIARQASVQRLQQRFSDIGIAYKAPPPSRKLCEKVPVNVPCLEAYSDIYDIIIPQVEPLVISEGDPLITDYIDVPDEPDREPEIAEQPEEIILKSKDYLWVDVTCGAGSCNALVIDSQNPQVRKTIKVGDKIEKDTIEVLEISQKGVKFLESEQIIFLVPARTPSRGGPSVQISSASQASGGRVASSERASPRNTAPQAAPIPEASVPVDPEPLSEQTDSIEDPGPPPALGDTGLF